MPKVLFAHESGWGSIVLSEKFFMQNSNWTCTLLFVSLFFNFRKKHQQQQLEIVEKAAIYPKNGEKIGKKRKLAEIILCNFTALKHLWLSA